VNVALLVASLAFFFRGFRGTPPPKGDRHTLVFWKLQKPPFFDSGPSSIYYSLPPSGAAKRSLLQVIDETVTSRSWELSS